MSNAPRSLGRTIKRLLPLFPPRMTSDAFFAQSGHDRL
jgi:hypothetical protein